jgi:hypothetical protein
LPRLELFPFRYRDRLTGKWVKARYVAERHEIAARYEEWEIVGPPEIRNVDPNERNPSHWRPNPPESKHRLGPQPVLSPDIDDRELVLVGVFLRRYVTYCARARRYAQMSGAARLLRSLRRSLPPSERRYRIIEAS